MHESLRQLLIYGVNALKAQSLHQARWTSDRSFITKMWAHPRFTTVSGDMKIYRVECLFDRIWQVPFRNDQLRFREEELSYGSLDNVYLSEFDTAILLSPFHGRDDCMVAQCLAISSDGFETFYENHLLSQ